MKKVRQMKKLSALQRFILLEAQKHKVICNADILIRYYGFKPISSGGIKFSPSIIGVKIYKSASVSVARAITRLRNRGLMTRGWRGHVLTPTGIETVNSFPR